MQLDAGGELVVMQQNLTTSSMEALQVRGKAVRLIWRRSNNRPVEAPAGASEGSMDQEEGHDEEEDQRWLAAACAVLALVAAACGSDERQRRRRAPEATPAIRSTTSTRSATPKASST